MLPDGTDLRPIEAIHNPTKCQTDGAHDSDCCANPGYEIPSCANGYVYVQGAAGCGLGNICPQCFGVICTRTTNINCSQIGGTVLPSAVSLHTRRPQILPGAVRRGHDGGSCPLRAARGSLHGGCGCRNKRGLPGSRGYQSSGVINPWLPGRQPALSIQRRYQSNGVINPAPVARVDLVQVVCTFEGGGSACWAQAKAN